MGSDLISHFLFPSNIKGNAFLSLVENIDPITNIHTIYQPTT